MKNRLIKCLALSTVVFGGMLASCGGTSSATPNSSVSSSAQEEATIQWQFTGEFHELMEFGFDYFFLGNMLSDGTGIIYQAQLANDEITYEETPLTFSVETDRDGLSIFTATTDDKDATFYGNDVQLYQESDGTFIWQYTFKFMGGYSRQLNLVGTDDIEYSTLDDWKEYVTENAGTTTPDTPDTPTKESLLVMNGDNGSTLEFFADNTAVIKAYGGAINFEYNWSIADGVITLTSVNNPSEVITSTTVEGVTTIVYSASLGGNQVTLTFTAEDISALE